MAFMSQFLGYTPNFGWGFELMIDCMVWGLPALAFLYLILIIFKNGTRPVKPITSFVYLYGCGCYIV